MPQATKGLIIDHYKQHEFEEGQDFEEAAAINGFSNHMKLLSKGSDDDNEVNKSEEFDPKHYFVGSFCLTGVSGSCVIPSLLLKNLNPTLRRFCRC